LTELSHWSPVPTADWAAAWSSSLSSEVRPRCEEFAPHDVAVTALHIGFMHTEMSAGFDAEKTDPAIIAAPALDGVEESAIEVLTDDMTRQAKAALSQDRMFGRPSPASTFF
jgi:hypothetical protein